MNDISTQATPEQRPVPEPDASMPLAAQPVPSLRPPTNPMAMSAGIGNAALADNLSAQAPALASDPLALQAVYGNGAVARAAEMGGVGVERPAARFGEGAAPDRPPATATRDHTT